MQRSYKVVFGALLVFVLALTNPIRSYAKKEVEVPNTSITVSIPQLGCSTTAGTGAFTVSAFSFGASQTTTTGTGGAGAGKPNVSSLNISKAFNECSPALFGALVAGRHYSSLRLVHADGNGNPVLTIDLSQVLVSSYQIAGSAGPDLPLESVSFAFAKICITDNATNTKMCYDASLSKVV